MMTPEDMAKMGVRPTLVEVHPNHLVVAHNLFVEYVELTRTAAGMPGARMGGFDMATMIGLFAAYTSHRIVHDNCKHMAENGVELPASPAEIVTQFLDMVGQSAMQSREIVRQLYECDGDVESLVAFNNIQGEA